MVHPREVAGAGDHLEPPHPVAERADDLDRRIDGSDGVQVADADKCRALDSARADRRRRAGAATPCRARAHRPVPHDAGSPRADLGPGDRTRRGHGSTPRRTPDPRRSHDGDGSADDRLPDTCGRPRPFAPGRTGRTWTGAPAALASVGVTRRRRAWQRSHPTSVRTRPARSTPIASQNVGTSSDTDFEGPATSGSCRCRAAMVPQVQVHHLRLGASALRSRASRYEWS